MNFENKIIGDFLTKTLTKTATHNGVTVDVNKFENFPVAAGQCFYIFNWKENKVTFQKGVKRLLGYKEDELDLNLLTHFIHPNDLDVVSRITKGSINHCVNNSVPPEDYSFYLTCRIRKKDGSYVKILRQSGMLELDDKNKMISNFSILTDVSFLSTGNKVEWSVKAPKLNLEKLNKSVYEAFDDFFTKRELQIITLLNKGLRSQDIAETLVISKHTVDTHRRKTLKKSGCKNLMELINFVKTNNIL